MGSLITVGLLFICLVLIAASSAPRVKRSLSPMIASWTTLQPLTEAKKGYEVYGYAPYWTFNKLANVDFNTLTTLAYFGVDIDAGGNLVKNDYGYDMFISEQATQIFKKAHDAGTKVDLTVTQMDNATILAILDNPEAQDNAVNQIVAEVKNRGIDGVNVDFEYAGTPGGDYPQKFTTFVGNLTDRMHKEIPGSKVTVAMYAISARQQLLYDVPNLSKRTDRIFMMAYDFAVAGSDIAEPTAPLYGFKEGKYAYDVSTAVDDFLKVMPADKLILGVPYYGYNYTVNQPEVKSATLGNSATQTYELAKANITPSEVSAYTTGWDNHGKVGWKAYRDSSSGAWRMIFLEDEKSLGEKYDFAKNKNLAGVGMWALGFDDGHSELWSLLRDKFGTKIADNRELNTK